MLLEVNILQISLKYVEVHQFQNSTWVHLKNTTPKWWYLIPLCEALALIFDSEWHIYAHYYSWVPYNEYLALEDLPKDSVAHTDDFEWNT